MFEGGGEDIVRARVSEQDRPCRPPKPRVGVRAITVEPRLTKWQVDSAFLVTPSEPPLHLV